MFDNLQLINVLKQRAAQLREDGLTHTVHYQELEKQIDLLEASVKEPEYYYPGSDCQSEL